ncbi:2-dehydropantoate 2-reductase N-terminal domain-containing protein [Thermodesulfobacteriota bacterium]
MKIYKPQILIVGANGAIGTHVMLKPYGNENLSVLILPTEVDEFKKNKLMQEDEWYPDDHSFISQGSFVMDTEPSTPHEIGVYTSEIIPAGFFRNNGIAIIASKVFHYDTVLEGIKPLLNEETIIFNIVNGLKPEVALEEKCRNRAIGNQVIRAVVMGGTHFISDSKSCYVQSGIAKFVIGNWGKEYSKNYQDQLEKVACLFQDNKLVVEPQYGNDFRTLSFDKVLANLVNPISAFTGCITIEYVTHDPLRDLIEKCINQGIDVGLALGFDFHNREGIIRAKLEMYEKAGKTAAKAHLPSMGQDSLRAAIHRRPLSHENEHIGTALVQEGLEAKNPYHASYIDHFSRILDLTTDRYNQLHYQDMDKAAQFLIGLMMCNRYSLGLNPNNRSLHEQFGGLEELESQVKVDLSDKKRITDVKEAASIFEENLTRMRVC